MSRDVKLPMGLGARHSAAASITAESKCIAVTVSQTSGTVRVFREGEIAWSARSPPRLNRGAAVPDRRLATVAVLVVERPRSCTSGMRGSSPWPRRAYYWEWARRLDLSYFDHPPLAAWTIALTTASSATLERALRLAARCTRRSSALSGGSPSGGSSARAWRSSRSRGRSSSRCSRSGR